MMTAGELIESMEHALGKTPDSRHNLWNTLNQAGRAFYIAAEREPWNHQWTWTRRFTETLVVPANASRVTMPARADRLLEAQLDGSDSLRAILTSPEEITRLQAGSTSPSNVIYFAGPILPDRATRTAPVATQWQVYPESDSEREVLCTFGYAWEELRAEDENATPCIPLLFERGLELMARAFAIEKEDQQPAYENTALLDELDRLVTYDAARQPETDSQRYSVRENARAGAVRDFIPTITRT